MRTYDKYAWYIIAVMWAIAAMSGWFLYADYQTQKKLDFIVKLERMRVECVQWRTGAVWAAAAELNCQLAAYKARGGMEYVPYIEP